MSHFSVMVVGEDVEKALAPYHEYECTGVKDEHVVWVDEHDQLVEDFEAQEEYKDLAKFAEYWRGKESNTDWQEAKFAGVKDGRYGRWTNPNAKWDWWAVGGRWSGSLIKKDGEVVDSCKKSELDYGKVYEGRVQGGLNDYQNAVENPQLAEFIYRIDLSKYPTIESYEEYLRTTISGIPRTFAIVDEHGNWYERGSMGWWGVVTDENDNWDDVFDKWFTNLPSETVIIVVDCHI